MAITTNITVGPMAWTHIASGRDDGAIVKVEGGGEFSYAVTVGSTKVAPAIPLHSGHQSAGIVEIPMVSRQQLWACASSPVALVVT